MGVIEFSLKRRVTVAMSAVALIVFGLVAFTRLPINLLPDLSYPSLTVETRFPGAAPAEVEALVSRPVEEAVGVAAGVQRLTSVSRPGLSQVTLEFGWGRNMDFASIDVREKLERVILPKEVVKPVLLRFDPANDPIQRLYLTGGDNLYQLRYIADEILKKDLESTEGVAAIKINGGYEEEIQVQVDQGKLALLGISIEDVNQRLLRENVNQAGGSLYESEARYLVRARNEFRDLEDILGIVLVSKEGRNVTMADVAAVTRGHKQRQVITRYGGAEAVELAIYKEGDANTVAVARAVTHRLERVQKELPAGVKVATSVDQSRFIQASIDEVISNAIMGGALAVIVLLLFLKDLTSTLIIGVSIPISIIATFFLMYQTGTTLNVMSLGGLALGVGMLVDNAIVVLEAIFKRRERGEPAMQAAQRGASEVGRAVVASTLTTIVVFLPVVFVEGIAAQIFRDQAVTVSFSLLASLVVALTLIPLMTAVAGAGGQDRARRPGAAPAVPVPGAGAPAAGAARARFVRLRRAWGWAANRAPAAGLHGIRRAGAALVAAVSRACRPVSRLFDHALEALLRRYPPILRWALARRGAVLAVSLLAFVLAVAAVPWLGVNLVPTFSQGEFSFMVELPEGTPLEATDRSIREVQATLKDDPRVESFSSITGGAGLSLTRTGTEGENVGRIQVRMKPGTRGADEEAVASVLRDRFEAAGLKRFKFERPTYFTFRTPIEVEIYSDDLASLDTSSEMIRQALAATPGMVDVKSTMEMGSPELQITFNREQLASLGLDLFAVAATVRNKVQGEVATRFLEGDREIDILVRSVEAGQASVEDVQGMIVAQRNGVPIFLKSVADIRLARGPSEIRRIGQNRAAVVSGNLRGRDMGAVAADVRAALRTLPLPAGVTGGLSGQEEEMERSFKSLVLALALAIFLVYMVMASEFESLLHPFVVMFTVPLGAVGAIGALAITGHSIDVVVIIGALLLAGIVVNNAIVLIDAVNQLRAQGMRREAALVEAGLNRMRPILMTSATTVLGLIPMALGLGEGGELQAPMAITVIGGLGLATVLTLLVIPCVYVLLDRKEFAAAADAIPAPAAAGAAGAAGAGPAVAPGPDHGPGGFFPGSLPDPSLAIEDGRGRGLRPEAE
jgi:HAE1 family hydrophobic/amphiphilic exporter-1